MNKIKGIITDIESEEGISLVTVTVGEDVFSSVVIDTPDTVGYLRTGSAVYLVFKETEMAIGQNLLGGLSMRNRFDARVLEVEQGKVLTKITLDFKGGTLVSVITTASARMLLLEPGTQVTGLVKTTEISLMKIES